MKLTKQEIKLHKQACEILKQETLTIDDKLFVVENWNEGAEYINSATGAFFTPYNLARHVQLTTYDGNRVIDLCAGIGTLTLALIASCHYDASVILPEIVCIEINPDYIKVGKKICPEATWIQGSIFDKKLIESLGQFDVAMSNPPFGNVVTESVKGWLKYTDSNFELKAIEVASLISKSASFILPTESCTFTHSGNRVYKENSQIGNKVKKFMKQTGIEMQPNLGIDCNAFIDQWKGVKPHVEIACFEFDKNDRPGYQQEISFE